MIVPQVCSWLENTRMAAAIRSSTWLFPTIESIHVLAVTLVVGSILMFDLRLLGIASRDRSVTDLHKEILPWTWAAFACAVVAGSLLFSSDATKYYENGPFRFKMLTLFLIGLNTAIFELGAFRGVSRWNTDKKTPLPARLAGGISIVLWILVVGFGRWIGFTKQ
ncbi:MAG: hypothetical protein KGL75_00795 [Acidobacteriota bacterium]|nr:hypothetical protein [Acidobacteriota bacterium]